MTGTRSDNPNVEFASRKTFKVYYVGLVLAARLFSGFMPFAAPDLHWTFCNVVHSILTFWLVHWIQGSPFLFNQQEYASQTFWEQLDDEQQFTNTRKFFTLVPLTIFWLACNESSWAFEPLVLNLVALMLVLVPKQPFMHLRRIFSIND